MRDANSSRTDGCRSFFLTVTVGGGGRTCFSTGHKMLRPLRANPGGRSSLCSFSHLLLKQTFHLAEIAHKWHKSMLSRARNNVEQNKRCRAPVRALGTGIRSPPHANAASASQQINEQLVEVTHPQISGR